LFARRSGNVLAMSIIAWSLAKLGYNNSTQAEGLFEAVAGEHERIVGGGDVQAMSNTCWAFATVGHKAEALFGAVAAEYKR